MLLGNRRAPKLEDYAEIFAADEAVEPILARPVRNALLEWLTEIWAAEELERVGLKARQRALFAGPPGTGKTTLAHHLAARLGLPLAVVRSDRVIDKWVGSTGKNIGGIFDAAKAQADAGEPVLLFFDEFDSLGLKRRSDTQQGAEDERNSSVNVLLARLEQHDGFVIAASNMPGDMDQAVWRRFDIQIDIALPGQGEREAILARYLHPYRLPDENLKKLAEAFETASPALMRQFAEGLKRQLVVGPLAKWNMTREAVVGRVLAAVQPHPDIGKPRLWSHGINDISVKWMQWPLQLVDRPSTEGPQ